MMQIRLIEVYIVKEINCFELFAQVPFIHEQYINICFMVYLKSDYLKCSVKQDI